MRNLFKAEKVKKMGTIKVAYYAIKWFAFMVWGIVSFTNVLPKIVKEGIDKAELFTGIDNIITTTTALVGGVFFVTKFVVYLVVELPHKRKSQKLERDIMREDLELKRHTNQENKIVNQISNE